MLQEDRFIRIQALLSTFDRVSTERLIKDMQVSRETIRKDLLELESLRLVRRVHGGVARVAEEEPTFIQRQRLRVGEKRAIAKAAAKRIGPGQLVFIDAGTTTALLVQELMLLSKLVVVTNSITIALSLTSAQRGVHHRDAVQVILLGGHTNAETQSTYGEACLNEVRRYRADSAILSPVGISASAGVSFFDEHEARLATAMTEQATELCILADYSKIGLQSRYVVAPAQAVTCCITNEHPDNAPELAQLRQAQVFVQEV